MTAGGYTSTERVDLDAQPFLDTRRRRRLWKQTFLHMTPPVAGRLYLMSPLMSGILMNGSGARSDQPLRLRWDGGLCRRLHLCIAVRYVSLQFFAWQDNRLDLSLSSLESMGFISG